MSESAPKDTRSKCGDDNCSGGVLSVYRPYGIDSLGRPNWSKKEKVVIVTFCLFCVATAAGVAIAS